MQRRTMLISVLFLFLLSLECYGQMLKPSPSVSTVSPDDAQVASVMRDLGFDVTGVKSLGPGRWSVQVKGFDPGRASGSMRGIITGTMRGQGVRMGGDRAQAGGTDDGGSATGSPSDKPEKSGGSGKGGGMGGILQSITVSRASDGILVLEEKALQALGLSVKVRQAGSVKIQ